MWMVWMVLDGSKPIEKILVRIICWGDEHPFTSYFDVHQGYKVLTHCHILYYIYIILYIYYIIYYIIYHIYIYILYL